MERMNKRCCAKCTLACVTSGMHQACVEDSWCSGAATSSRCLLKMSSRAAAGCHWGFTKASPLCSPPLCPVKGEKNQTSPWCVHLWSHWDASAPPPFFLPPSSFCRGAVKSSEDSVCPLWSLIVPDWVPWRFHQRWPPPPPAQVESQPSRRDRLSPRPPVTQRFSFSDSLFLFKVKPLVATEVSFLTLNSECRRCNVRVEATRCRTQTDLAYSLKVQHKFIILARVCLSIELLALTWPIHSHPWEARHSLI